jgi:tetratricopeptide (TPR) repeat protein
LTLAGLAFASDDDGKIPVTTKSDEARELFIQGRALVDKIRGGEAAEYFERAVKLDPEFAIALLYLAGQQNNTKSFYKYFEQAKKHAGNASEGERLIIQAIEAGRSSELMKQRMLYKQLCVAYPNDARAHAFLAGHFFAQQEYEAAILKHQRAIEIDPEYSPSYNEMGYCYRYLGEYEKAEEAFKQYIELIPDDPNPYDSYAELLMKIGRFDESIEYYRKALEVNPDFLISHRGVASNLMFMDRHDEAREEIRTAIAKLEADYPASQREFIISTAIIYVDEGRYDLAIQEMQKRFEIAKEANDINAQVVDLQAIAFLEVSRDNIDDAERFYKEAYDMVMTSEEASSAFKYMNKRVFLYQMAIVASKNGNTDKARELAEKYREKAEAINSPLFDRAVHRLFGLIALDAQEWETAIEEFEQANIVDPFVRCKLADAYAGAGRTADAREQYELVVNEHRINDLQYATVRNYARDMLVNL